MNMELIKNRLALLAIVGGISRMGMAPNGAIWGTDSMPELIFGFVACFFMALGIIGIYLYQSHLVGYIGYIATILYSISSMLTACLVWNNILGISPDSNDHVSMLLLINSLIALISMIMFAVGTIRARIYPVWFSVCFLLFPVLSFVPVIQNWSTLFWGLSFVLFGYYALTGRTVSKPGISA